MGRRGVVILSAAKDLAPSSGSGRFFASLRMTGAAILLLATLQVYAAETTSANSRATVTAAAAPSPSGPYERTPIRRSAGTAGATSQPSRGGGIATPGGQWDLGKVPLALGGVIVLILVMRWIGKGILPGSKNARSSRVVQVLVRSAVGPKQQLMLVQVGRRLVLVGAGGAEMNPLCQIDDPDEVAELLGQIRGERGAVAKNFGALFGRAGNAYDETPEESEQPEESPEESDRRPELDGLMERVKRISNQFQES
jgi:flagellar protein FliO/FliZ